MEILAVVFFLVAVILAIIDGIRTGSLLAFAIAAIAGGLLVEAWPNKF
jgi:hypothetical protein